MKKKEKEQKGKQKEKNGCHMSYETISSYGGKKSILFTL